LHIAVKSQNIEMIDLLIKYDVDVNAKDALYRTPLYFALN
jgi:ankyrin repeat protein